MLIRGRGRVAGAAAEQARRSRFAPIYFVLLAANLAAWGWAWLAFSSDPVLLASALLAYVFGLRHAVDADHIAAIDNATRKLIETGRPAGMTGLFFSLGHATVVILAAFALALLSVRLRTSLAAWKPLAGALSTGLSAAFLFALAVANGLILISLGRLLADPRRLAAEASSPRAQAGPLGWLLRGLFRFVGKAWHLYPIGFIFGLGFDTATEIGVLGLSATQASHAMPLATVMVFPALFTAGMTLVDTLDAVAMAAAYRWAATRPRRRHWYNLTVTGISVVTATAIGGIELLGLWHPGEAASAFWQLVAGLNEHWALVGASIVALFAVSWVFAAMVGRARNAA